MHLGEKDGFVLYEGFKIMKIEKVELNSQAKSQVIIELKVDIINFGS